MKRKGVNFDANSAKRLVKASQYVEQQPRNQAPAIAPPVDFGGGLVFHVTTALNPMSGATPGANGRAKMQQFNGTSYSDASSTVYKILNDTTNTVAVGSYIVCVTAYGYWHYVMVNSCSNIS